MQSNYNFFSYYYDKLTQNVNYQKRAQYFQKVIEKYLGEEKCILLDLACGTGSLSEEFAKMGYDVIGVDYSEEMLNIALDKKFDSGLNIQYLCQDMRNIDMFGTVKVTVCALDSINHLSSLEDIKKVFEKVSLFTEPGGIYIFDINTKYKHKKIFTANNTPTFLTGLFEFTNLKKIFPNNKYTSNFWPEKNQKITKPIELSGICGAYLIFRK